MRNFCMLGIVCVVFFLGGCASHSATKVEEDHDEQVDLYLSTLDDKHFVWCTLDLEQCWKDFENWKTTPRGRVILREYEKENTGQTYNMHQVPNIFRTRFVDESHYLEQVKNVLPKHRGEYPPLYGPEVPHDFRMHFERDESP